MPIRPPGKDESQSDFMQRCVSEQLTPKPTEAEQSQAVAICYQIWRDKHPGADPGHHKPGDKSLHRAKDDDDKDKPYGDVEYADPGLHIPKNGKPTLVYSVPADQNVGSTSSLTAATRSHASHKGGTKAVAAGATRATGGPR